MGGTRQRLCVAGGLLASMLAAGVVAQVTIDRRAEPPRSMELSRTESWFRAG